MTDGVDQAEGDDAPDATWLRTKMQLRMAGVDAMPEEIRQLVHVYGLAVVEGIMACGVRKPRRIRHIVETVLNELSPTRAPYSAQGPRSAESLAAKRTAR